MAKICRSGLLATLFLALTAPSVRADFHLWQIDEIYSDPVGRVQYVEFATAFGGQQFLGGHQLQASLGGSSRSQTLAGNLPGDSANRRFLVATQSFADLGLVTPDYVIPDGFLFLGSGSIALPGADLVSYSALPADGMHASDRHGNARVASPTNFAGQSVSLPLLPVTGLWAIDAEVTGQPGRGFTIEVQNSLLVLTVFGYTVSGDNTFFQAAGSLSNGSMQAPLNTYRGGTPFGGPISSAQAAGSPGTVTLSFVDAGHGTITFPGESAKAISKFNWSTGASTSVVVPEPGLWAVDAEVNGQPGRGFTLEVQSDVLVLTVFGYSAGGEAAFYQSAASLANGFFQGRLDFYRNGTAFGAPFREATLGGNAGNALLSFSDSSHGSVQFPGEPAKAISKFAW